MAASIRPKLRIFDFERQRQLQYRAETIAVLEDLLCLAKNGGVTSVMFWVHGRDFPVDKAGLTGKFKADPASCVSAALRLSRQLAQAQDDDEGT